MRSQQSNSLRRGDLISEKRIEGTPVVSISVTWKRVPSFLQFREFAVPGAGSNYSKPQTVWRLSPHWLGLGSFRMPTAKPSIKSQHEPASLNYCRMQYKLSTYLSYIAWVCHHLQYSSTNDSTSQVENKESLHQHSLQTFCVDLHF
jgi:hypothetical protein